MTDIEDLRIGRIALGGPYHAALVGLGPSQRDLTMLHRHADFCEVFYVVSGSGAHRLDAGTTDLEAGQLVLVRPADMHNFSGASPSGIVYINVAFPIPPWQSFLRLLSWERLWEDWQHDPAPPSVMLRGATADRVQAAFQRVLELFQVAPAMTDLVRLWCDIVPLLTSRADEEVSETSTCPDWLQFACAAMDDEDNLVVGLPRLRRLAGVSSSYLARTMRAHYGMSPIEWVTALRLKHSAMLLTSTRIGVSEVATRCGFASQSYFSRCFQQVYGSSPRAYRNHRRRAVVP